MWYNKCHLPSNALNINAAVFLLLDVGQTSLNVVTSSYSVFARIILKINMKEIQTFEARYWKESWLMKEIQMFKFWTKILKESWMEFRYLTFEILRKSWLCFWLVRSKASLYNFRSMISQLFFFVILFWRCQPPFTSITVLNWSI